MSGSAQPQSRRAGASCSHWNPSIQSFLVCGVPPRRVRKTKGSASTKRTAPWGLLSQQHLRALQEGRSWCSNAAAQRSSEPLAPPLLTSTERSSEHHAAGYTYESKSGCRSARAGRRCMSRVAGGPSGRHSLVAAAAPSPLESIAAARRFRSLPLSSSCCWCSSSSQRRPPAARSSAFGQFPPHSLPAALPRVFALPPSAVRNKRHDTRTPTAQRKLLVIESTGATRSSAASSLDFPQAESQPTQSATARVTESRRATSAHRPDHELETRLIVRSPSLPDAPQASYARTHDAVRSSSFGRAADPQMPPKWNITYISTTGLQEIIRSPSYGNVSQDLFDDVHHSLICCLESKRRHLRHQRRRR